MLCKGTFWKLWLCSNWNARSRIFQKSLCMLSLDWIEGESINNIVHCKYKVPLIRHTLASPLSGGTKEVTSIQVRDQSGNQFEWRHSITHSVSATFPIVHTKTMLQYFNTATAGDSGAPAKWLRSIRRPYISGQDLWKRRRLPDGGFCALEVSRKAVWRERDRCREKRTRSQWGARKASFE